MADQLSSFNQDIADGWVYNGSLLANGNRTSALPPPLVPLPGPAGLAPTTNLPALLAPAFAAPLPPAPPPPPPPAPTTTFVPAPPPAPVLATTTTGGNLVAAAITANVGPPTFSPAPRPLPTTYENGAQRVKFVEMARRGWFRTDDWFLLRREVGGIMHTGYARATVNASNRVVVSVGSITQQVDGPREIIDLMAQVDPNLAGRPGEAAWQLLEFVRDGQNYSSLHDVREHYWKWKQRQM
ncbi:hypothetical protein MMC32_000418 [Xylographa parallela]|nr:hypothetical protein [Xylographa parallela]